MGFEKPREVRDAQLKGDTETLRRMQQKSVESRKNNKAERKDNKETTLLEASLHEAHLQNDAEAIAHFDEMLRQLRGDK